jgi:kinesin family protein 5
VLLVNCSPSSYNANETLSTLRFGSRAKRITNKPKINEQRSVEELTILLQKAENAIDMQQSYIEALEGQLRACDGGGGGAGLVAAAGDGTVALQGKVVALATELSEERDETLRARTEVSELTAVLREKERLLGDASELLRGAERHCEGLRARSEALEMERLSAQAEGASAADALSEAEMRAAFEISELRATVEKLSGANERLTAELEAKEAEDAARTLEESSSRASSRSPPPPSSAAAESLPVSASVRLSDEQLVGLAEAIGLSAAGLDWVRQREHVWEQWAATTVPRSSRGMSLRDPSF